MPNNKLFTDYSKICFRFITIFLGLTKRRTYDKIQQIPFNPIPHSITIL